MKNVFSRYASLFIITSLMLVASCTSVSFQPYPNTNATKQNANTPYDYNKRYVYIFSVKKTDGNNRLLNIDTIGLMSTTSKCSDSVQNVMSWVHLKTINGKYKLNDDKQNESTSGIISNGDSLFIHPARDRDQYPITEICAYPYLHFPLYLAKEWNWNLAVADWWCPSNIKWKGDELFKHKYIVSDTMTIDIPQGKAFCFKIQSSTSSELGNSSADFYYSYQYGIVKMDYLPLDKTKIEMNLIASFDGLDLFKKHEMFYSMFQPKTADWNFGAK